MRHARRASVPGVPPTAREKLQSALLAWFAENGRDLPWRHTRDPYAILVSEVMLQQTQVARVLERYPPWLERWPTATALAAAPAADVLRAWSGLGYNRRALGLQNAARRVVELGEFPRTIDELERLPGVGPYTARAIACFAFDAQVTALDTNVRRVLERSLGTTDAEPPPGRAWHWNQALFDLGAQLCLARVPRCEACPLAASCPSRGQTFAPLRRQGRFEGSRRQRRAALVRELAAGPRTDDGYDRDVVDSLVADGLAVRRADGLLALPEEVTAP
jgi:A/G-specific adenine glycosylase